MQTKEEGVVTISDFVSIELPIPGDAQVLSAAFQRWAMEEVGVGIGRDMCQVDILIHDDHSPPVVWSDGRILQAVVSMSWEDVIIIVSV